MLLTKARDDSPTTDVCLQCTHVDPHLMVKSGHFVVKVPSEVSLVQPSSD